MVELWLNFTDICSWGPKWPEVINYWGGGWAPKRRQAITWTNDDLENDGDMRNSTSMS